MLLTSIDDNQVKKKKKLFSEQFWAGVEKNQYVVLLHLHYLIFFLVVYALCQSGVEHLHTSLVCICVYMQENVYTCVYEFTNPST